MIITPYYIAASDIHGMGVFSDIDLKQGDIVWRYDSKKDITITIEDFKNLTAERKNDVINHAQWYPEKRVFLLGCDGDYFMNHAEDATLMDHGDTMTASCNLKRGTELTCDYRIVQVIGMLTPEEQNILVGDLIK